MQLFLMADSTDKPNIVDMRNIDIYTKIINVSTNIKFEHHNFRSIICFILKILKLNYEFASCDIGGRRGSEEKS